MIDIPSLVIGLILAIPVGIVTNLLSPRVERAFGHMSERRRARTSAERAKDDARVAAFVESPTDLTHYLLTVVMTLATLLAIGVSMLVLAGVAFMIGGLAPGYTEITNLVAIFFGGVAVASLLVIPTASSRALTMAYRVRVELRARAGLPAIEDEGAREEAK